MNDSRVLRVGDKMKRGSQAIPGSRSPQLVVPQSPRLRALEFDHPIIRVLNYVDQLAQNIVIDGIRFPIYPCIQITTFHLEKLFISSKICIATSNASR